MKKCECCGENYDENDPKLKKALAKHELLKQLNACLLEQKEILIKLNKL